MIAQTTDEPGGPGDRLLPWGKVKDITGLSRSTAWRRTKAGDFPKAVQISPGRVGWWESELTAWKASRAPRSASELPAFTAAPRPAAPPQGWRKDAPPAVLDPSPSGAFVDAPVRRRRRQAACEGQIAFEFG